MEISQIDFLYLFFFSLVSGICLGVLYNALGIFRLVAEVVLAPQKLNPVIVFGRELGTPFCKWNENDGEAKKVRLGVKVTNVVLGVLTALLDVIFMLSCAVGTVIVAYACNSGRLRWIIFAGELFGFFLYRCTVSKIVVYLAKVIILSFINISVKLCRMIAGPIKKCASNIRGCINKVINKKASKGT